MLNSGKKRFALCATKKINILTPVLSEKKILNEKKTHSPPPCKLTFGRSLRGIHFVYVSTIFQLDFGTVLKT